MNAKGCLRILEDPAVQMSITMQQMVMRPRAGELVVTIPGGSAL